MYIACTLNINRVKDSNHHLNAKEVVFCRTREDALKEATKLLKQYGGQVGMYKMIDRLEHREIFYQSSFHKIKAKE